MLADVIHKVLGFEKEDPGVFYPRPSIAGPERCMRSLVYSAMGVKQTDEMGDRFVNVLSDSSWHEELTNDAIQKTVFELHSTQMAVDCMELDFMPKGMKICKTCGKEIPISMLHGHIDGIFTDLLRVDRLYEHKAINHFTFQKYWNNGWPLDYFTQSCLYIKGLKKDNPDISEACLLIKNKNTSQFLDFVISYDDQKDIAMVIEMSTSMGDKTFGKPYLFEMLNICGNVWERFRLIHQHRVDHTLPAREFEISDWQCDYCRYKTLCWADYEKEFCALAENVELEGELVDMAKYYLELNMHLLEMDKEKENLKGRIKKILKDLGVRQGRAGEYTIHRLLQKRKYLNKDKIPPTVITSATETRNVEILCIRKPKKKEVKNG